MSEHAEEIFELADNISFQVMHDDSSYQKNELRIKNGEKITGKREVVSDKSLYPYAENNRLNTVVTTGNVSIQESVLKARREEDNNIDLRIVLGKSLLDAAGKAIDVALMGELDEEGTEFIPTVFERPAIEQDKQTVHLHTITEDDISEGSDGITRAMEGMSFERVTDETRQLELLGILRQSLLDAAAKANILL